MNRQSSQEGSPVKTSKAMDSPKSNLENEGFGDGSSVKRTLSLFDCVCIIVGTIIGAGIFRTPSTIAQNVPNEFWMMVVWCVGGAIAMIGALCFAELTTSYPDRGGDYGYLKRAYGRWMGFAFSWTAFWVIRPGNISVMAIVFGIYARDALLADVSKMTYALSAVVAVSAINLLGLKAGKWSQNLLAVAKVAGILLILLTAIIFVPREQAADSNFMLAPTASEAPGEVANEQAFEAFVSKETVDDLADSSFTPQAVGSKGEPIGVAEEKEPAAFNDWFWLALVFVMFSFGGWNDIAFVAGEVRQPNKNLFRSLMLGTMGVLLIYLLFNMALLLGMGQARMAELSGSNAPTEFVSLRIGDFGGQLLAILVCVSCIGAVSAMIFTSPRIYWATAVDYPALRWLAGSRDGNNWRRSMVLQAIVTAVFILVFGRFEKSFDVMVIASAPYFWGFLALTVISLMVLRQRHRGDQKRQFEGYRVPLYPVLPIVFVIVCLFMTYRAYTYMMDEGFHIHALCIGGWILLGVVISLLMTGDDREKFDRP